MIRLWHLHDVEGALEAEVQWLIGQVKAGCHQRRILLDWSAFLFSIEFCLDLNRWLINTEESRWAEHFLCAWATKPVGSSIWSYGLSSVGWMWRWIKVEQGLWAALRPVKFDGFHYWFQAFNRGLCVHPLPLPGTWFIAVISYMQWTNL